MKLKLATLAAIASINCGATLVPAQTISNLVTPTAWNRGDANTTFYGWDIFEPNGPAVSPAPFVPGGQPQGFIGFQLNDSTPDLGTDPGGVSFSQNLNGGNFEINGGSIDGYVRQSTNLYSGFAPGDIFDATAIIKSSGVIGTGFTTVLVQMEANGVDNFSILPSEITLDGSEADAFALGINENGIAQLWMEWNLTGNSETYNLDFLGSTDSGNLGVITIDTAWTSGPQSSIDNANVTAIVPEPAAASFLLLASLAFVSLRRRRR